MFDIISEAMESPGFWILGSVGSAMVIIGWIISKKMEGLPAMPFWQIIVVIITVWLASAFFGRE